jgi:sulfur carrier protein
MVSVQLNGEIIDRNQYQAQTISEGDELDFLYFMGGGAF